VQERRIVERTFGPWAVWTQRAVALFQEWSNGCLRARPIPRDLVRRNAEITDANAAFFDVAHNFTGCIAGLHEVLRRQGLLEGNLVLESQKP